MKRFQNSTVNVPKLIQAILLAEQDLHPDSDMMGLAMRKNDWKYNAGTGYNVFIQLATERDLVSVYVKKGNPRSAALGMYSNGVITFYEHYVESATVDELRASLRHEYAHYAGFNHASGFRGLTSNYKTKDKCLYSVPYWLSEYGKVEPATKTVCYRSWKTFGVKKCYEVAA
jgi:hypothetical protein